MERNPFLPPIQTVLTLAVGVPSVIILAGIIVAVVVVVRHRRSQK